MDILNKKKILVVDDDAAILELIESIFTYAGADVICASDGRHGMRLFYASHPDLVVLDILMPGVDGWQMCDHMRLVSDVSIIMLTGLNSDGHEIRGLNLGADDFLGKPFKSDVLLARARATLRRRTSTPDTSKGTRYHDTYLTIDLRLHQVRIKQRPVRLTPTEFKLLSYLLQNAGQVLTYQQIIETVWGWDGQEDVNNVHVHVSHLRHKLERKPKEPEYLHTVHGIGYRFDRQN